MAILEGHKLVGARPDDEYCAVWNEAIQSAKEQFACFNLDPSISGATGYEEKEDMVYHIGPPLPR